MLTKFCITIYNRTKGLFGQSRHASKRLTGENETLPGCHNQSKIHSESGADESTELFYLEL